MSTAITLYVSITITFACLVGVLLLIDENRPRWARLLLAAPLWPLLAAVALPVAVMRLIKLASTPGNPREVEK